MMSHVEQRLTVSEFLAAMRREHRDLKAFRDYVRRHPRDVAARLDLEDFEFYAGRPDLRSETMDRAVSLIPVAEEALAVFTRQRLALLDALAKRPFPSVRELAAHLKRDVHNVHADLQIFRKLGIVAYERGSGNRRIPRLRADSIRVVVEPSPVGRLGAHPAVSPFAHENGSQAP